MLGELFGRGCRLGAIWQEGDAYRGVSSTCAFCNSQDETVSHYLFKCDFSYKFWMECIKWLGLVTVFSSTPVANLIQFSSLHRGQRSKQISVCTWACGMWLLWTSRNDLIFHGKEPKVTELMENLKSHVWNWFAHRSKKFSPRSFHDWCVCPLISF